MQQINEGNVLTCTVNECGFYMNDMCHAPSIMVGDQHPTCDTFTTQPVQQADVEMSDVAACNATDCNFNQNRNCTAPGITVSHHGSHADCLTYRNM